MSSSIQAAKAAGDEAYRSQQFSAAVEAYSQAMALCERLVEPELLHVLYSNRSAAKLALQDYSGALADAQQSVAVNDSWVKGWYRSAKALQGLGKWDLAAQAAQRAQQLEPHNKDVGALLQELKLRQQPQQHQQQQQHQQPDIQQAAHATPSQPDNSAAAAAPGRLPWSQLNALRSRLDLKRLPAQLVVGSRYLPSPDGINHNLLLLLHGLGDTPTGFTALAQRMSLPQTACLALSGPLSVPESDGGRAWLTAFDEDGELIQPRPGETRRTDSLATTLQLMQQLLFDVLPAVGGWRPCEVQLLGFSQGGCTALNLARLCSGPMQLGGVVAICSALLPETLSQLQTAPNTNTTNTSSSSSSRGVDDKGAAASASGTPVLITYGDRDTLVDRDRVDRSVSALRAAGCPVELKVLPGKGHSMIDSEPEMRACMKFWANNLRQRPPGDDVEEVQ